MMKQFGRRPVHHGHRVRVPSAMGLAARLRSPEDEVPDELA